MGINFSIDITAGQRKDILALLERHLPNTKAWAYGSRVSWTSRPQSDIDMVVFATPEQKRAVSDLREAFEESSLPFRVDLFVWDDVPGSFRKQIEREHVVLTDAGRSSNTFETATLGEVTKLTLSSVDKKTNNGEFTVSLCSYMDVHSRRSIQADIPFMTATATSKEIDRCRLQADDVIIIKDSEKHDDIGVSALVRENIKGLVCGYHLAILRPSKDELHGPYLYYALQTREARHQFHSFANGVTRFGLRKDDILRVKVPLPPFAEQRAIAGILGALDDKIALNRRRNETLEAMARAIFKDWFVDFGPTRAKAEGRAPYLAPELWELFPDALDGEDKPEGWKFETLERLAVTNPKTWTTRHHPPTVEYVDLSNTKRGNIESTAVLNWEAAPSRARRVTRKGDTIIATTRLGNGSFSYIQRNGLTASTGFAVLSPRRTYYREFVYLAATSGVNIMRLASLADGHGGAYPTIKPKEISETVIVFPRDDFLISFSDLVSPIRDKIERAKTESIILAQARDLLLPQLISGAIRVRVDEMAAELNLVNRRATATSHG